MAKRTLPARQGKDGLENVVAGMGTSHDKRVYTTWAAPVVLTRDVLENMYRSSWLAKRIVNVVADDMTRKWIHYRFDDRPKDDDTRLKQFKQAMNAFKVKTLVNEALRWARLYGGSLILIGLSDVKTEKDWAKPTRPEAYKKDSLRYLRVIDRWRASSSSELTTDLSSPNFGLPEYYTLAESSIRVHYSRVLRFNGQKLPHFAWRQNGCWDDSELQHVYDALMNCDTTTQAVATMIFEANVDVIKSNNITELLASRDGERKILKRFQVAAMMKSFNRTLLLDGSEEYEKKSNSFANLHDIIDKFMVNVCGSADIPMTRLFGQSASGLNSTNEGDLSNYYDKIHAEQDAVLRPSLEQLCHLVCQTTFGSVPDGFEFDFNPLWQLSEAEQATMEKTRADRDKVYTDMGVIDVGLVARELQERGTYRTMTTEDVDNAEEMAESLLDNVNNPPEEAGNGNRKPGEAQAAGGPRADR